MFCFRNRETQKSSLLIKIISLCLLVISSFFAGFYYSEWQKEKLSVVKDRIAEKEFVSGKLTNKESVPKFLTKDIDFNLYWDLQKRILDNYVDKPVSETKLFYGSLMGMAAAVGDPYTAFFDPEVAFKFQQELSGSFEGIGAEIGIKDGKLTVISPLPETPAEKAGLRAGDQIFYINDIESVSLTLEEAVSLIRGPKGTTVTLKIWRDGNGEELLSVPIVRDEIRLVSADWKKIDNDLTKQANKKIVYIKIRHFNEDVDKTIDKIAKELSADQPDGIILDLRNNPGGFLDRSVHVAGKWIKDQVVVKEKESGGAVNDFLPYSKPSFAGIKTVVLINGGSASASEIVAGALQDYGLATIVGENSFGKGSVQDYQQLPDGSALKITIAKWLTPNGRSIQKNGITPDVKVELTNKDYEENKDPQFDKAVEVLLDKIKNQ